MAVPFDAPVSVLEGVGPAAQRLLESEGVFGVFDLLRAPSPALHRVVSSLASLDEVRAWRQMAVLLEVAAVTPQWAEALVRGGVTSLLELSRLDLAAASALFAAAEAARVIPQAPSTDEIVTLLVDATRLEHGGAITGTIRDREGEPVEGVSVRAGGQQATSDARGRFRLLRLRLGRQLVGTLEKEGLHATPLRATPRPTSMIEVVHLTMPPALRARPRPEGQESRRLSEREGDVLPPPDGTMTSRELERSALRVGDLLVLSELYANGRDAKLVSKLLEHDGARLVARWVRVPRSELGDSAALGEHFLATSRGFRKIALSPRKLRAYKELLRARRALPRQPAPASLDERHRRVGEALGEMARRMR